MIDDTEVAMYKAAYAEKVERDERPIYEMARYVDESLDAMAREIDRIHARLEPVLQPEMDPIVVEQGSSCPHGPQSPNRTKMEALSSRAHALAMRLSAITDRLEV